MRYPNFVSGSATSESVIADAERTVNWAPVALPSPGATVRLGLFPTPGFRAFLQVADKGASALWAAKGRCFGVVGRSLYELFENGTSTNRGAVAQNGAPATVSFNAAAGQLLITSGSNAYCYVLATNTLTLVLNGVATMGAMLDGYGLVFDVTTGRVRYSAINDFTTWDPLNFFENSITADPWQAMVVDENRQVWLLGEQRGQVWYDSGAASNPFQPIPGAVFSPGTAATWSVVANAQTVCWLAASRAGAGTIVAAQGYDPQQISTTEVVSAITGYARTSSIGDAEMLVHEDQGRVYAALTFPRANATWATQLQMPFWHERGQWNAPANRYDLWAPRVHCYAFGKHLVGDRDTGVIAAMDTAYATEISGAGIRRLRRAPGLTREGARLRYDRLQLLMDVGIGAVTGQGSNPLVMLRVSRDGGRTWSSERRASAGRIGEWRRRVYWNRLGIGSDCVFEISVSDPVPWRVLDAWINPTEAEAAGLAAAA
jgi:hypothetical protein